MGKTSNRRVLLINPNTFREPPAIPLALEYVGVSLVEHDWEVHVIDLCFSEKPAEDAVFAARVINPVLTALTIRNVDTALYQNNRYFIPGIKEIVQALKAEGCCVALGGAGFSAAPEQIVNETGADYGIFGPGELALPALAESVASGEKSERIINGWKAGIDPDFAPARPFGFDYERYLNNRGIPGFATHYGCDRGCVYCIEAGTPLIFRSPEAVIKEIRGLVSAGYREFHLCDSEFNHDLEYSEEFAGLLADSGLVIKWSLYMQPSPCSGELMRNLKASGAEIITLSVDSSVATGSGGYGFDDVKFVIDMAAKYGIRLAVDLSTGLPGESEQSTVDTIEFFRNNKASTVGVNSYYRVYPGTILERKVKNNKDIAGFIIRPNGDSVLAPSFYNHLPVERLSEIIGGDSLFRIEGFDEASNYERLADK